MGGQFQGITAHISLREIQGDSFQCPPPVAAVVDVSAAVAHAASRECFSDMVGDARCCVRTKDVTLLALQLAPLLLGTLLVMAR